MERTARRDILARVIGLLVFVAGVCLLLVVFIAAYKLFSSPSPVLAMTRPKSPVSPTAANLTGAALFLLAKVGLLFIMTLVGSLIAARGAQLYLACGQPPAQPSA